MIITRYGVLCTLNRYDEKVGDRGVMVVDAAEWLTAGLVIGCWRLGCIKLH